MDDMRAIGEAIRDAAPRDEAPVDVRGRLFSVIARARAGTQPTRALRRASWTIAAAVLAALLVGGAAVERLLRDAPANPISAIVQEHARALADTRLASGDEAEVTRWIGAQVDFAMYVPSLPGARLVGARLCVIDGRRGAVIDYDVNGVPVSYFVVPEGTGSADASRPARFDSAVRAGYRVVSWRAPGLLHAMVGNLPEGRLAALAKVCVQQARGMLAALGGRVHSQEG